MTNLIDTEITKQEIDKSEFLPQTDYEQDDYNTFKNAKIHKLKKIF